MKHNLLRLIVCGGRDYTNAERLNEVLSHIHAERCVVEVIHGNQRGADKLAGAWARANGVKETPVDAEWEKYHRPGRKNPAGPIRNGEMLKLQPDGVVAFRGGSGTTDMVGKAEAAGVPVMRIDWGHVQLQPS